MTETEKRGPSEGETLPPPPGYEPEKMTEDSPFAHIERMIIEHMRDNPIGEGK
jgi:hypothetical protein